MERAGTGTGTGTGTARAVLGLLRPEDGTSWLLIMSLSRVPCRVRKMCWRASRVSTPFDGSAGAVSVCPVCPVIVELLVLGAVGTRIALSRPNSSATKTYLATRIAMCLHPETPYGIQLQWRQLDKTEVVAYSTSFFWISSDAFFFVHDCSRVVAGGSQGSHQLVQQRVGLDICKHPPTEQFSPLSGLSQPRSFEKEWQNHL